jgi:small neutral amino acid transporter SnatA (MarC family)
MAKSVRALTMNQKPCPERVNSGILVVTIAVEMMSSSGTAALRTHTPSKTSSPG